MRENKMIKNIEAISDKMPIMFCFPYAGGGASVYNKWLKLFENLVTVCPIQLPGREDRISDALYTNMDDFFNDITELIEEVIVGDYYLWGHSMGGRMVYEVEKKLEKSGYIAKGIFVSGSRAPHIIETDPIYHLPDAEFKERLSRFDGTPKEILENQMLFDFFLPLLRADFTMDETYKMINKIKLISPVFGLCGKLDKEANQDEMAAWGDYTENSFNLEMFEGGHFFIKEQEEFVINYIKKVLEGLD